MSARWQFADTVTMSHGNHTVKFGGDINFVKDIINNLRFIGGEFNYTGANDSADFIVDYTDFNRRLHQFRCDVKPPPARSAVAAMLSTRRAGKCYAGNFNQGFGVLGLTMKTTDLNYFIQDDWRFHPRFTLESRLALRVSAKSRSRRTSIPTLPQTNNKVDDRNNFGPRIGFAYDSNGDGKTSHPRRLGTVLWSRNQLDRLQRTGQHRCRNRSGPTTGHHQATTCDLPERADLSEPAHLPIIRSCQHSNPPVGAVQFFD